MTDYGSMSLAELKQQIKDRGIKGASTLKKAEIIELLSKEDSAAAKSKTKITVKETDIEKEYDVHETPNTKKRTIEKQEISNVKDINVRKREYNQNSQKENTIQKSFVQQNSVQQNSAQQNYIQQKSEQVNVKPEYQQKVQRNFDNTDDLERFVKFPGKNLPEDIEKLDSHTTKRGILEIMQDGYGFIRCDNFLPGEGDVFVAPYMIKKLNLKTGDIIEGNIKIKMTGEKFTPLLYIISINGFEPLAALKRPKFDSLTPIYPNSRIKLETQGCEPSLRIIDILSPIGKGQRGMIVSPPKAGKTTLLKQIAKSITRNYPEIMMLILLVDERPEEVTDIKESIKGKNVQVIYSTFDELPENHKRVSEMVIEHAKRLVEHKKDVVILLDSITRLARANNQLVNSSGRTLSGGLDPAALYMPKKFFGAARNMREGGSLTVLATALVDTGSRMDDVVFEEFKGTGNMELVLDRNLSEKRIFPAIDLPKSSTRKEELLLTREEREVNTGMRKMLNNVKNDNAAEILITEISKTASNKEFMEVFRKKYRSGF